MNLHTSKIIKSIGLFYCALVLGFCKSTPPTLVKTTPSPFSEATNSPAINIVTPLVTNVVMSDVNILFEAKTNNTSCHGVNHPFEVVLSFTNLSDGILKIADQFTIAKNRYGLGGNIIPFITLNGEDIHSVWDNSVSDFPSTTVDANYLEILPHKTFNKTIEFYFPKDLLEIWPANPEIVITPSPGKYLITFSYYQSEQPYNSWHGFIDSNPLEICVNVDE